MILPNLQNNNHLDSWPSIGEPGVEHAHHEFCRGNRGRRLHGQVPAHGAVFSTADVLQVECRERRFDLFLESVQKLASQR